MMTDEYTKESIQVGIFMFVMILAIILIALAFKVRDSQDRIERLEEQLTERKLEEPATETTEIILPKEPSDDEIVMEVRPELLDDATPLEAVMVEVATPSQAFEEPQKFITSEVTTEEIICATEAEPIKSGLTAFAGVYQGPSGKETYYNLDMSGVIAIMRSMGYSEDEYPYWVRDDGVKMFGQYVMVAAELSSRPKGTILETSLGTGMVVDTGGFASGNPAQLDIATAW